MVLDEIKNAAKGKAVETVAVTAGKTAGKIFGGQIGLEGDNGVRTFFRYLFDVTSFVGWA